MSQLEELEKTFIEEYESAVLLLKMKKTKASTILFAKALFAIVDYIIFKKYKKLPRNHTDRFRILQEKEQQLYERLDLAWSTYTDSYSKPSKEESTKLFQKAIEEISTHESISQAIAACVKNA